MKTTIVITREEAIKDILDAEMLDIDPDSLRDFILEGGSSKGLVNMTNGELLEDYKLTDFYDVEVVIIKEIKETK